MELLQQIINGISLGSIYALIALGYTMVYGIVRLINFAHGDVYMAGAYIAYLIANRFSEETVWRFPLILLASMGGCSLLGMAIERVAYKPLRNRPRIATLTTAIGVSIFLENLVRVAIGPNFLGFPEIITRTSWEIKGITISNVQVVVPGCTVLLVLVLHYVVHKTKAGKAMRAVSFDRDVAMLMGVNVDNTIRITFAIGSALAAAAGVLVGIAYPRIDPYMGIMAGLKAFVSAVLGGIGIIPGAALGGLMMGVAEVMAVQLFSSSLKDAIAFVVLIVVLLVKPTGLLGKVASEKV
ncbi:MAG TPA: branched-chain amino acid ABC transporter permease [Firmicutes bacterium]|nr:branched-chain amino acid ABC transporter permease [Bacillota bacterium]